MQKIVPHLWFDKEAKAAATLYTSLFPNSKVNSVRTIHDTPSGDADVVSFHLAGCTFAAISAGPYFKANPSISFMVNFDPSRDKDAKNHLDEAWKKLIDGGQALMPLGKYPFSEHYGWLQDRWGISWQLILTNPQGEPRPLIVPSMMFVGGNAGKAEEATNFYMSVFKDCKRGTVARYPKGMAPDKEGTLMFTDFQLEGQWFAAMDSAHKHEFNFNEAVSLMVNCDTQQEIDYFWEKLSTVKQAEQCGWCKDKYGVSWQVTPTALEKLMSGPAAARVTQAFLKMKKFDIAKLEEAAR